MASDDRFNPASATREMFAEAITRALGDMTDEEIRAYVQSAVGTEMSQRQMADLNLQTAIESSVSSIRSEMTHKASTSDVTAAVGEEAAARQAADAELHDAVGAVANAGAKNLLHFDGVGSSGDVYTHNGITFTLNPDMTVTATGTASANAYAYIKLNGDSVAIDDFCDGNHILSGCPANGSAGTYRLYVGKTGYRKDDTGSGVLLSDREAITGITIAPYVSAGYAIPSDAPLVFKPMIRRAEITDDTFTPYAPTNRELYEMILALQSGAAVQSVQSPMRNMGTDRPEVSEDA